MAKVELNEHPSPKERHRLFWRVRYELLNDPQHQALPQVTLYDIWVDAETGVFNRGWEEDELDFMAFKKQHGVTVSAGNALLSAYAYLQPRFQGWVYALNLGLHLTHDHAKPKLKYPVWSAWVDFYKDAEGKAYTVDGCYIVYIHAITGEFAGVMSI